MHESSKDAEVYLSIVIRTRNEAKSLRQVFEALTAQRCRFTREIVVVDNESEDETVELCEQYDARVVSIRRSDFTYGRALNLGISQAQGKLVLLLSAHSLPVGSYFLESAVAAFDDPQMAAVRCLDIGNYQQIAQWYKPKDVQYQFEEQQKAAETGNCWTNDYPAATCCVIRRSVWEQVKYDEYLESVEDKLWASQVLRKGYKIRRCAEAVYLYTRQKSPKDTMRRRQREFCALYRISGYVPMSWPQFLLSTGKAILLAPAVAVRHVVKTVTWNTYLLSVPWQAKSARRVGSVAEFDKHA